jgi:hypothetical protein
MAAHRRMGRTADAKRKRPRRKAELKSQPTILSHESHRLNIRQSPEPLQEPPDLSKYPRMTTSSARESTCPHVFEPILFLADTSNVQAAHHIDCFRRRVDVGVDGISLLIWNRRSHPSALAVAGHQFARAQRSPER